MRIGINPLTMYLKKLRIGSAIDREPIPCTRRCKTISVVAVLSIVLYACSTPEPESSLAKEYATLAEENATLKVALEESTQEAERLRVTVDLLENERNEWRSRAGDLEQQVDRLKPEILPEFQIEDLEEGVLTLRRVFSIRTGQCFDHSGRASCLFAELGGEEGGGYVLYKANRVFPQGLAIPDLHNAYGDNLSVVTPEAERSIRSWELENPHHSIRTGSY